VPRLWGASTLFGDYFFMKTQLRISKADREKVLQKYDCRCGYCGKELTLKTLQVDHIIPVYRGYRDGQISVQRGEDTMDNYMPSCARCNRRKSTWTVEQFREQIRQVTAQFRKYNPSYMLAVDYGMIKETYEEVVFYFEKCNNKTLTKI
jgi:hypothetical protein